MSTSLQANQLLTLTTPLGPDVLLPTSLHGVEAISQLFRFDLELIAPLETPIPFERILGQTVTAELRQGEATTRYFSGIVNGFTACGQDAWFTHYRAQVVPALWWLTKMRRSRIFQHLSTPEILARVLDSQNISFKLLGSYHQRNYCVQYQETDFDFISRLMEEEGIHYSFTHTQHSHQLVLSDSTSASPRLRSGQNLTLASAAGLMTEGWQITRWAKTQKLRAGRYVMRDHNFEMPGDPLEVAQPSLASVQVGTVQHPLRLAGSEHQELHEYPGRYAKQHEQVGSSGAMGAPNASSMFETRDRLARVRMEAEECAGLCIEGEGDCGMFVPGTKFDLHTHGDSAGSYLLSKVEHVIHNGSWRSDVAVPEASYSNRFVCLPADLPYRPACTTPRPLITGFQTAIVVGPEGEELFCDVYGRIKVQFHWDREGRHNAESSCWLRVSQIWAGNNWGAFFWPRIGHEVVVMFENGDPDCPLITGSVYNAANMPPYKLPAFKQYGGVRSASIRGNARQNFNGIVFNDTKGTEHLSIHSEHNMTLNTEYDKSFHAGRHKGERVASASVLTVGQLLPKVGSDA